MTDVQKRVLDKPKRKKLVIKLKKSKSTYETEEQRVQAKPIRYTIQGRKGPERDRDTIFRKRVDHSESPEKTAPSQKNGTSIREKKVEDRVGGEKEDRVGEEGVGSTELLGKTSQSAPAPEAMSIQLSQKRRLVVFRDDELLDTDKELNKTKLLPGLHCNVCSIGVECPEYEEDFACAYEESFSAFPSRTMDSVLEGLRFIVDKNKTRLFRSYHHEEAVNGGMIDPNVTSLSNTVLQQMNQLIELDREHQEVKVSMSGEGTTERAGGMLSRLFGGVQTVQPQQLPSQAHSIVEVPQQQMERFTGVAVSSLSCADESERLAMMNYEEANPVGEQEQQELVSIDDIAMSDEIEMDEDIDMEEDEEGTVVE